VRFHIVGEHGVPAYNQSLPRTGRVTDLGKVSFIKQGKLKRTTIDKFANLGGTKGRYPFKTLHRANLFPDPGLYDKISVPYKNYSIKTEPVPDLPDLSLKRKRVSLATDDPISAYLAHH